MIVVLARSIVPRSRYNHSRALEAVKFQHKQNIAQQSCSCLIQTPLPWFCLSTQLRPGSRCRFYTQSQSHFLHVSPATFSSLENELKTTENGRLFSPLLLEMTPVTRQLDLSQCFLIDGWRVIFQIDRKPKRLQPGPTGAGHGAFSSCTSTSNLPPPPTLPRQHVAQNGSTTSGKASCGIRRRKKMRSVSACVKMTTSQFCFLQLFSEHSFSATLSMAHWSIGQGAGRTSLNCSTKERPRK